MMEEKIRARIEELVQEREQVVAQANMQLAAYNAAIGELERLLTSPSGEGEAEGVPD